MQTLRRLRESDFVLVLAFELRRQFGARRWRVFARRTALAIGFGCLVLLAIDKWLPPVSSWTVAVYMQPIGLGPQLPDVRLVGAIPLWSIWSGYIGFSWMIFFVLLWSRMYIAVRAAASLNDDRRSGHREMEQLAQLSRAQTMVGKILAPVAPCAVIATLLILITCGAATSAGGSLVVPLRVWCDVMLQLVAVSAICRGLASRWSQPGTVLAASLLTSLVGVSAVLWLYDWPLKLRHLSLSSIFSANDDLWSGYSVFVTHQRPFRNLESWFHWIPLAAMLLTGHALAPRASSAGRSPRFAWLGGALAAVIYVVATAWLAMRPNESPEALRRPQTLQTELRHKRIQEATEQLALRRHDRALTLLAARETGTADQEAIILRACALFSTNRFAEARSECGRLVGAPLDDSYFAGLAACNLAAGRDGLARECLRFAGLVVDSSARIRPARDNYRAGLAVQISNVMRSVSRNPGLPFKATFLRWAATRYPREPRLRLALRQELLQWAATEPQTPSNLESDHPKYLTQSGRVRRALMREAAEHDAALRALSR